MELQEIRSFIGQQAPFNHLSQSQLSRIVNSITIQYFRRDSLIIDAGSQNQWLSVLRSGAVELTLGGTDLAARLGEGDCFGYPSLIRNGLTQNRVTALEDCLLYRIPKAVFLDLRAENPAFGQFFDINESARLRQAVEKLKGNSGTLAQSAPVFTPVKDILRRVEVIRASITDSVAMAARIMAERDVSTLLIYDGAVLAGIITDKDLRRRVLGPGLDTSLPVTACMTPHPRSIHADLPVMTALLIMLDMHIHHLPVTENDVVIGVIGASDLLAHMGANTLQIADRVRQAPTLARVADATALLPRAVSGLIEAGVDADHIGRFVSAIGEQSHARLLALAEADLGPAPVRFALVAFGSLARSEQALGSDQDNGFVFGEGYDAAKHDAYFAALATRLCDGLNAAGYVYCPGNIMATNPKQRLTLGEWQQNFTRWIKSPTPEAILNCTIFFDMRCMAGDETLVDSLRSYAFEMAKDNRIFQSFIARSAAGARIPLGFFRNLILEHDAVEGDVLNLKTQAIAPIVDIARAHALGKGIAAANTQERLAQAAEAGSLSHEGAADLRDCLEFIRDMRFRHQGRQIKEGQPATNKLAPDTLSRFDREHLRDAFKIIRAQLDHLRANMAGGVT